MGSDDCEADFELVAILLCLAVLLGRTEFGKLELAIEDLDGYGSDDKRSDSAKEFNNFLSSALLLFRALLL